MRVLFIGGTGQISLDVGRVAVERGIELYLLTRGQSKERVEGAHTIVADIHQPEQVKQALNGMHFDVIVNWIAFVEGDVERDIALFAGKTDQYIFISSASAYQKPPVYPIITESTPLYNPYWQYSRDKIACENRLMAAYREHDFPVTIVRPSLTYRNHFPVAIGGWGCYTLADRLLKGQPIIVHGDGSSIWPVTHTEDFARGFVPLIGHPQAIGQAFHITSDTLITWDQIYKTIAHALGVQADIVYIPSDFIARVNPELGAGLLGDKSWSVIFDNSKIRQLVPDYKATIPFHEGVKKLLAWFDEDPARKWVAENVNHEMDAIISAYRGEHK